MTGFDRSVLSISTDARVAGWLVSLVLHGTLAFGAFLFLQHMKLAPQQTPFQWDVAMVAPAPHTATASTRSAKQSAPPTPATESAAQPVPAKIKPAVQPSELPPPIEQTHIAKPLPSQPVAEQIPHPTAEQAPLARMVETMDRPATPMEPITPLSPPATPLSQRAVSAPMAHPSSPLRDSEQANSSPHVPTLSAASQSTSSASAESTLAAQYEPETVPKDGTLPQQVASLSPSDQAKSVKADNGWFLDDVTKWQEHFKEFYPPKLRLEGTEGRVKLRMLVGEDGAVSDVHIAESSGNALLDQEAVEIARKAPPIKLSHPLGRPKQKITFWYQFKLNPAR